MGWEHSHPDFQVCRALTRAHENLNNFIKCHKFKYLQAKGFYSISEFPYLLSRDYFISFFEE